MKAMGESLATPIKPFRRRWVIPVLGMLCLLVLLGGALFNLQRASRVEAIASEARKAVESGPLEEATQLLDQWSALKKDDGEPDYYRAWLEIRGKQPAHAMDSVRSAMTKGYPQDSLEVLRAILLAQADRFEEAIPTLTRAFQQDSGPLAEIADALVRYSMKTVRLRDADTIITRWMALAPRDARPYIWRADIYKRGGRESELMIRDLRDALERDPSLDDVRLELASVFTPAQIDETEEQYTKVLEHRPRNTTALVGLGKLALLKGDIQGAERRFEEALAIDPKVPLALKELALLDVKFGRINKAKERLKLAVSVDPDDLEMQYAYARVLASAGDEKAATEQIRVAENLRKDQKQIERLRQELATQPDNLEIRYEVARWLIRHDHDEEGLDWARRILTAKPDHSATCQLLAEYYTKKKNPGLANYYRMLLGSASESSRAK